MCSLGDGKLVHWVCSASGVGTGEVWGWEFSCSLKLFASGIVVYGVEEGAQVDKK